MTPPRPWPGLFDRVPAVFRDQIAEPAFSDENGTPLATVCFWREQADSAWNMGVFEPPPHGDGGFERLFDLLLAGSPEAYQQFAEDYYEQVVDIAAVRHVYALRPLTQDVVSSLNSELDVPDLEEDLVQIGYPASVR